MRVKSPAKLFVILSLCILPALSHAQSQVERARRVRQSAPLPNVTRTLITAMVTRNLDVEKLNTELKNMGPCRLSIGLTSDRVTGLYALMIEVESASLEPVLELLYKMEIKNEDISITRVRVLTPTLKQHEGAAQREQIQKSLHDPPIDPRD